MHRYIHIASQRYSCSSPRYTSSSLNQLAQILLTAWPQQRAQHRLSKLQVNTWAWPMDRLVLVPRLTHMALAGVRLQELEVEGTAKSGIHISGSSSRWDSGCPSFCLLWHAWLVGLTSSSPSPTDFYNIFHVCNY